MARLNNRTANVCNHCAADVKLTRTGRMGTHRLSDGSRCPGSGLFPTVWRDVDTPRVRRPPTLPEPRRQPPPPAPAPHRLSAAENSAIEKRAVFVVREHFRQLGFATEDVGATESYDVRATLGNREVLIEVKGTTGGGESITLTANEVRLHRTTTDNALAIVRRIELKPVPGNPVAVGGELVLTMPWVPDTAALRPIAYSYDTGIT